MQRSNRELWAAFFAILGITALYVFVLAMTSGVPAASGLFGHGIGILGFILMLMTETLYTLRKRSRSARWGRMSTWLNFHIFTGIVGPYMVLLHSSWKFNGLAGVVMLMTVVIVVSGFVGRYIYTAIPRTADGVEMEAGWVEEQVAATQLELQRLLESQPQAAQLLGLRAAAGAGGPSFLVQAGSALDWRQRLRWRLASRKLNPPARRQAAQLQSLLQRQETLRRQVSSLAMARRMMALWHAVHIPIGMALFTAAFIHIVAAIYYATLLH